LVFNELFNTIRTFHADFRLKFRLVAEGKTDVCPRFGPAMEWDTAAGRAIAEEAKGFVVELITK
jgi:3'(2'), 5'-bisphosphate nucleotidase